MNLIINHPKFDVNAKEKNGYNAHLVLLRNHESSRKLLALIINHPKFDVNYNDPLGYNQHIFILSNSKNSKEALELILTHPDLEINVKNEKGDNSYLSLLGIHTNKIELAKLILTHPDLEINDKMPNGYNAHFYTLLPYKSTELFKLIINRRDFNVNDMHLYGHNAHLAFLQIKGETELCKLIINRRDFDVNNINMNLVKASKSPEMAFLLLSANPDLIHDHTITEVTHHAVTHHKEIINYFKLCNKIIENTQLSTEDEHLIKTKEFQAFLNTYSEDLMWSKYYSSRFFDTSFASLFYKSERFKKPLQKKLQVLGAYFADKLSLPYDVVDSHMIGYLDQADINKLNLLIKVLINRETNRNKKYAASEVLGQIDNPTSGKTSGLPPFDFVSYISSFKALNLYSVFLSREEIIEEISAMNPATFFLFQPEQQKKLIQQVLEQALIKKFQPVMTHLKTADVVIDIIKYLEQPSQAHVFSSLFDLSVLISYVFLNKYLPLINALTVIPSILSDWNQSQYMNAGIKVMHATSSLALQAQDTLGAYAKPLHLGLNVATIFYDIYNKKYTEAALQAGGLLMFSITPSLTMVASAAIYTAQNIYELYQIKQDILNEQKVKFAQLFNNFTHKQKCATWNEANQENFEDALFAVENNKLIIQHIIKDASKNDEWVVGASIKYISSKDAQSDKSSVYKGLFDKFSSLSNVDYNLLVYQTINSVNCKLHGYPINEFGSLLGDEYVEYYDDLAICGE